MKADLHMHTTYSDGRLKLEEVINNAINNGLQFISITDHDTLKGSIEAYFDKDKYHNINIIFGVELSTYNNDESVHVLGYFNSERIVDVIDFERYLEGQRKVRNERAFKIKEALLEHFRIDLNWDFADGMISITRGTIANEIINQGYNYSRKEIFEKMIGEGCPAYFPSTKLSTKHGIKLIQNYGGIAVLAHPTLLKNNSVEDLIKLGFDGIEAIYPLNRGNDEKIFRNIAKKNNLIITAGSDFHAYYDNKHGQIGDVSITGIDLEKFLKRIMEVK